jgi:hypothetical protein
MSLCSKKIRPEDACTPEIARSNVVFAGAVAAHERHQLARAHFQVHALQRRNAAVA